MSNSSSNKGGASALASMLSPDVSAAIDRMRVPMQNILDAYAVDKKHVKALESFKCAIKAEPLLNWDEQVHCARVAVHPRNRGGLGIVRTKCESLGAANTANGYVFELACGDALASSIPPYNADHEAEWSVWNTKLNARQNLPALQATKIMSLGAGHSNGWLRLVDGKCECSIKTIAPNGKLDPDDLCIRFPEMAEAIRKGLRWHVVHHAVFDTFDGIADICQKALNSKNQQQPSEPEGLLTMAALASSGCGWDAVEEEAVQTRPAWQPWASAMVAVVKSTPLEIIQDMASMAAALMPPPSNNCIVTTHVGQSYMEKVAAFRTSQLESRPRFRMALLISNMMAPAEAQESSKCTLVLPGMVTLLGGKKYDDVIKTCENLMDAMRKRVIELGQTGNAEKPLGLADARIVYHVLGLGPKSRDRKAYTSLDEIAEQFLESLRIACGLDMIENTFPSELRRRMRTVGPKLTVVDPKKVRRASAAAQANEGGDELPAAAEPSSNKLETLAECKDLVWQIGKLGYTKGALIAAKKRRYAPLQDDGAPLYKISKINNNGAKCALWQGVGAENIDVTMADLRGNYYTVKQAHYNILGWEDATPTRNDANTLELVKGSLQQELYALYQQHDEKTSRIYCSPFEYPNALRTINPVPSGKLLLVPYSRNVGVREH